MSQRKTLSERIDEQLARKAQMEAEIKRLQQKQKAEERNKRTHRICTRGGMIEGMLPDTIDLTDDEFRTFLERTVANSFGRQRLDEILARKIADGNATGGGNNKAKPPNPQPNASPAPSPKPMPSPQDSSTSGNTSKRNDIDRTGQPVSA